MDKPVCPKCDSPLKFRSWSKRLPAKSEALAECTQGHGYFQVRYWNGRQTSEPYQVAKKDKEVNGSYRLTRKRKAAIVAQWGSVQYYLDYGSLLPCITEQE